MTVSYKKLSMEYKAEIDRLKGLPGSRRYKSLLRQQQIIDFMIASSHEGKHVLTSYDIANHLGIGTDSTKLWLEKLKESGLIISIKSKGYMLKDHTDKELAELSEE